MLLFCAAGGAALLAAEVADVPFAVGRQQFQPGDSIVIDQVLATSPKLTAGDTVVVRGHYRLASAAKASLGLFVTHRSPAPADPIAPTQTAAVIAANGAFELSCTIGAAGALHVSFYPASGGEAFGGVYFSPAPDPAPSSAH